MMGREKKVVNIECLLCLNIQKTNYLTFFFFVKLKVRLK